MDPFVQRIIQDLKDFSSELIEPGIAPRRVAPRTSSRSHGLTSGLVRTAERLASLVPHLIANVDRVEDFTAGSVQRVTRSPARATPSRRAADYAQRDGEWVPTRWLETVSPEIPAEPPLRWLLHLIDLQDAALVQAHARLAKQVDEALAARQGESRYAEADMQALQAVLVPLEQARMRLRRATGSIQNAAGKPLAPSTRLPNPFPQAPAWQTLRAEMRTLTAPASSLPDLLRQITRQEVAIADIPYLYQRWCGVKLIESLQHLGWQPTGDTIGPLFLGGRVEFVQAPATLTLWVEPRVRFGADHPSGFRSRFRGEVTPDFLLAAMGRRSLDAWVVDATKTADEVILRGKAKYLESIVSADPALIAGVPVERAPLRAWAAAPINDALCRLFMPNGRSGTLPMHPMQYDPLPVADWMQDISDHALAWAAYHERNGQQARLTADG